MTRRSLSSGVIGWMTVAAASGLTVGSASHGTLIVSDNGPGLAPDVLERIMEPFFTTKPDGLGLGLSISAESLASMNGSIEVANHAEGGAEFTLSIPVVLAA